MIKFGHLGPIRTFIFKSLLWTERKWLEFSVYLVIDYRTSKYTLPKWEGFCIEFHWRTIFGSAKNLSGNWSEEHLNHLNTFSIIKTFSGSTHLHIKGFKTGLFQWCQESSSQRTFQWSVCKITIYLKNLSASVYLEVLHGTINGRTFIFKSVDGRCCERRSVFVNVPHM